MNFVKSIKLAKASLEENLNNIYICSPRSCFICNDSIVIENNLLVIDELASETEDFWINEISSIMDWVCTKV